MLMKMLETSDISRKQDINSHLWLKVKNSITKSTSKLFGVSKISIRWKIEKKQQQLHYKTNLMEYHGYKMWGKKQKEKFKRKIENFSGGFLTHLWKTNILLLKVIEHMKVEQHKNYALKYH